MRSCGLRRSFGGQPKGHGRAQRRRLLQRHRDLRLHAGAPRQIYTAPQKLTDIQLRPGEKIVGKPATGDNIRWVLARGASSAGGIEQQHIYIKPTRPDLDTTLAINTDQRSYILELHSYEDAWMAAVAWRYPQEEIAQLESTLEQQQQLAQATTAPNISIDKLNFNYGLAVMSGRPQWQPLQVFDDGHKTYIRFPSRCSTARRPSSLSSAPGTRSS